MKKRAIVILAALLLAAPCWAEMEHGAMKGGEMGHQMMAGAQMEQQSVKGEEVTMTGQLSCTYCKLAGGASHQCSPGCCQACVKAGDSVLFQDDKDNLYLLLNKEKNKPLMTPANMDFAGGKVKIKGILNKTGGLQTIFVESMEKAM